MDVGEIHSLWEVLSQKAVGVLVGTALPGTLRITKVHFDVGGQTETRVVSQLFATIPSQRLVKFPWSLVCMFNQRIDYRLGVFARHLHQHDVTRLTLDQGRDLTVVATDD